VILHQFYNNSKNPVAIVCTLQYKQRPYLWLYDQQAKCQKSSSILLVAHRVVCFEGVYGSSK